MTKNSFVAEVTFKGNLNCILIKFSPKSLNTTKSKFS